MNTKEAVLHLYQTRIDISETTRAKSIAVLNSLLATCLDLYSQTKQAHWNVKEKTSIRCISCLTMSLQLFLIQSIC